MDSYSDIINKIEQTSNKIKLTKKDIIDTFLTVENIINENKESLTDIIPNNIENTKVDKLIIRLNILEGELKILDKNNQKELLDKLKNIKNIIINKDYEQLNLDKESKNLNKKLSNKKDFLLDKIVKINALDTKIKEIEDINKNRNEYIQNDKYTEEEKNTFKNTINQNNKILQALEKEKIRILSSEENLKEEIEKLKNNEPEEVNKAIRNIKAKISITSEKIENISNKKAENTDDTSIQQESNKNETLIAKVKQKKYRILLGIVSLTSTIILSKSFHHENKNMEEKDAIEISKNKMLIKK